MSKGRLEAFSDGVIAILIAIMVLDLKVPTARGERTEQRPGVPGLGGLHRGLGALRHERATRDTQ